MILDAETAAMIHVAEVTAPMMLLRQTGLHSAGGNVPIRPEIEQFIRGRIEWVAAGLERCPGWFRKTLTRFDKDLRLRWDFYQNHWVIERYGVNTGFYHRVGVWTRPLGRELIEALKKGDMTRTATADKVKEAEEQAERQREANRKKSVDGYMEQFDKMTLRQREDFVEVSKAIEHGETLSFAGQDAEFMNKVWEKKKQQPDVPDTAINPGGKPGVFYRKEE